MAKKFIKKCDVCQKTFTSQRSTARYCPDCRVRANNRTTALKQKAERAEKAQRKANAEKGLNKALADLRKYNEKHGTRLSYGKFMAMKVGKQ